MSLPLKPLPILERWDCHSCGTCCRGTVIDLSDADLQRLRDQHWERHPDFHGKRIFVRIGFGRHFRLAQRGDGTCVFYDADNLCRIHREFGYDAKPLTCRMSPLQMVGQENFAYVTLRRFCPAAAADDGRPVKDHLDEYRRLVSAEGVVPRPGEPPRITHRCRRPWKDVSAVAGVLNEFMLDERYPLVRRLVHGLEFCNLLKQCRWRKMQGSQLLELLAICKTSAVEAARPMFVERMPPSRSASRWFRQIALEYLRLYPDFVGETSWRERGRMIHAALAYAWGKGRVPCFRLGFPNATFADLERPLGTLSEEVMRPLTRYFERAVVSLRYAVFKGPRWSLTEGFASLAMGFPVALWMLRFSCGQRVPEVHDVTRVVMMLDRGETHLRLVGQQHRWRIGQMASDDQIARLTAWYAR